MLDEEFQKEILAAAMDAFPGAIDQPVERFSHVPEAKLWANVKDLVQRGLVTGLDASAAGDPGSVYYLNLEITAAGRNFLKRIRG